jgi:purine-binding chemotaxis protein CheW
MTTPLQFLVFTANSQHYALRLNSVERIVRAVEITTLPESSPGMLGVVNIQGQIVPVVNFRKRFGLPIRDINLDDRLIIANIGDRTTALLVDTVIGVVSGRHEDFVPSSRIDPGIDYSEGMIKLGEEMVVIPNLSTLVDQTFPGDPKALAGNVISVRDEVVSTHDE